MTKMKLGYYMDECPQEWKHFIYHYHAQYKIETEEDIPEEIIKKELSFYNAVYDMNVSVEFQNEEDLILFKLTWA